MKPVSRRKSLADAVALCVCAGVSRSAFADGDDFFGALEIPGDPEFVYFGSVKDSQGNVLEGVEVMLEVSEPLLAWVSFTNFMGRYRTVDAGRAVVDLGYEVDVSKLTVTVALDGYTMVRRINRAPARAKKGAYELNFVMAPDPGWKARKAGGGAADAAENKK